MGWNEKINNVCGLCSKKTVELIRVKIEEDGVYHPVRNICKECVSKNGYIRYLGEDVLSDWN